MRMALTRHIALFWSRFRGETVIASAAILLGASISFFVSAFFERPDLWARLETKEISLREGLRQAGISY